MSGLRWGVVLLCVCLISYCFASGATPAARGYKNFRVAVYVPEYVVEQMKDPSYLQSSWETISGQVKVDKVYLETYPVTVTVSAGSLSHSVPITLVVE